MFLLPVTSPIVVYKLPFTGSGYYVINQIHSIIEDASNYHFITFLI